MKAGATITGNTSGGGVRVSSGGSFTMEGGEISGNTGGSGGVIVQNNGSFIMKAGAKISGNSATNDGGGVAVRGGSNFIMEGGEISGNTANYGGGGVGVFYEDSFSKTGGVIYGDNDGDPDNGNTTDNTAKYGNSNGHAVSYFVDGYKYYRDATLETGDNISTGDTLPPYTGSTVGYWTKK
jgi:hypothetical protein